MRRPALAALAVLLAATGCTDDEPAAGDVDMVEVRDALEDQVRDTIGTVLYENPGSRADLLADVPTDEPELWAEINADGEITYDEFLSVRAVADAVLTHSNDIVTFFEEMTIEQAED